MKNGIKFGVVSAIALLVTSAGLPVVTANAATTKTVTVGVVGDTSRELWERIGKRTQKEHGIKIKLKEFNDYVKPNQALADAGVINGNFAHDANLKDKDILVEQNLKKDIAPYINLIAAPKDKANKKVYKQIVKAYQTKETKADIKELFDNSQYAAWNLK